MVFGKLVDFTRLSITSPTAICPSRLSPPASAVIILASQKISSSVYGALPRGLYPPVRAAPSDTERVIPNAFASVDAGMYIRPFDIITFGENAKSGRVLTYVTNPPSVAESSSPQPLTVIVRVDEE